MVFGNGSFHVPPITSVFVSANSASGGSGSEGEDDDGGEGSSSGKKMKTEMKKLRGELKSSNPDALLGQNAPFEHVIRTILHQNSDKALRLGKGVALYIQSIVEDITTRLIAQPKSTTTSRARRHRSQWFSRTAA